MLLASERGQLGETYCLGGGTELPNIELVGLICANLDALRPRPDGRSYTDQIAFVTDRPGHDRRYAIDPSKLERETGWRPQQAWESGLKKTIEWYVERVEARRLQA